MICQHILTCPRDKCKENSQKWSLRAEDIIAEAPVRSSGDEDMATRLIMLSERMVADQAFARQIRRRFVA